MALAKHLEKLPQAQAKADAIVNDNTLTKQRKGFSMGWLKGFFNKPKEEKPKIVQWVEEDGFVREI